MTREQREKIQTSLQAVELRKAAIAFAGPHEVLDADDTAGLLRWWRLARAARLYADLVRADARRRAALKASPTTLPNPEAGRGRR